MVGKNIQSVKSEWSVFASKCLKPASYPLSSGIINVYTCTQVRTHTKAHTHTGMHTHKSTHTFLTRFRVI